MSVGIVATLGGAVLLVLSDVVMSRRKRRIRNYPLLLKFDETSKSKYVRWLHERPESKGHKKLKKLIKESGLKVSPEAVQLFSYLLPGFMFAFFLAIKYTNVLNTITNIEELRKVAEIVGDSSIAQVNTEVNWALILSAAFAFHYAPRGMLKILALYRSAKSQKEVLMLQTYAIMMLKTGKSVKQVLITVMDRSTVFKGPLEKAVNNYSYNPQLALKDLRQEVGNKGFEKLVIALEQAINSDKEISIRYLENHRVLGKEIERINRRGKNARKSMMGILLMIFPLLMLLIVGGYPWFVFSLKVIDDLPI